MLDGGRRIVFHLRAARATDGSQLTADDVVRSWLGLSIPKEGRRRSHR